MKKYNLYFNFFNGYSWRKKTIDQVKDIITNQYSSLIQFYDDKIYNDLLLDFWLGKDFKNLAYFKDGKKFISIREVTER